MAGDHETYDDLLKRIEKLEQEVAHLKGEVHQAEEAGEREQWVIESDEVRTEDPSRRPVKHTTEKPSFWQGFEVGENWLNRLGIGLLLLGVAFLFKYSIDQGWLIPQVRSLIGIGIGLALFIPGLQMKDEDWQVKSILQGGGIAVFYITAFATFQLYHFLSPVIIWAFMIIVTALSLSLSLQQKRPVLSIIGTIGGLGTPFMLYTGAGSLAALIVYTALVLTGAGIIYLFRAWRSLLWTMVIGGWLVLLAAYGNGIWVAINPPLADRWALQSGILVLMAIFWALPVIKELPFMQAVEISGLQSGTDNKPSAAVLSLAMPVAGLAFSMGLWGLGETVWGCIAIGISLGIGSLYPLLKREGLGEIASAHAFSALTILTIAFFLLLEGNLLFTVLALEALGLRVLASQNNDQYVSLSSHLLFVLTAAWLANQFLDYGPNTDGLLSLALWTYLLIIAIAGLAAPRWMKDKSTQQAYYLAGHIAFLGWFLYAFSAINNAQAYVSALWGLYAVVLIVSGFVYDTKMLRGTGMATVFLVVGKLFLIDLAQLEAFWRILLFLGVGAVFLVIGIYLQKQFGDKPSGIDLSQ